MIKIDIVLKYDPETGNIYTPSGRVFLAQRIGLEHAGLAKMQEPSKQALDDLNWWLREFEHLFKGHDTAFEALTSYVKALEVEYGKDSRS